MTVKVHTVQHEVVIEGKVSGVDPLLHWNGRGRFQPDYFRVKFLSDQRGRRSIHPMVSGRRIRKDGTMGSTRGYIIDRANMPRWMEPYLRVPFMHVSGGAWEAATVERKRAS